MGQSIQVGPSRIFKGFFPQILLGPFFNTFVSYVDHGNDDTKT